MPVGERPEGLAATTILMCITNAMGWAIIDWTHRHAGITFVLITITIAASYLVLWFYWRGKNWARILVLLNSLLCLYNLRFWNHGGVMTRVMIGAEAALAIFLLYWLNTQKVRAFFRGGRAVDA